MMFRRSSIIFLILSIANTGYIGTKNIVSTLDSGSRAGISVVRAVDVSNEDEGDGNDSTIKFEYRTPPTYPPYDGGEVRNKENKCDCHPHDGKGARVAYLIGIHNHRTLNDAIALFKSISAPGNIIIIHIDSKLPMKEYQESDLQRIVSECPCGAQVHVERKFDAQWGSWSMNFATHWSMTLLVTDDKFSNNWDVFINLSADSLPVFTPQIISLLFSPGVGPLSGTNFVTSSSCSTGLLPTNILLFPKPWHKRQHYTSHPGGNFEIDFVDDDGTRQTKTLDIYFGSQWMMLTPGFVKYLISSLRRKDSLPSKFRMKLIETKKLMTDETFIPTLIMNDEFWRSTMPKVLEQGNLESRPEIFDIRFERMDEHHPTAFGYFPELQRYDVPIQSNAEETKIWGPYYLGVYDLGAIKDSGAIFIRKVTTEIDSNLVELFPVENSDQIPGIYWPKEVKLSKIPDWSHDHFRQERELLKRHREMVMAKYQITRLN